MFLDFFLLLKNDGFPISLREYLVLLEALDKRVVEYNIDDFYFLSRATLVKHETQLDRFDQLFGVYFKGLETISSEKFAEIPKEWLERGHQRMLSEEDKAAIKAMGGLEALMERMKELMKEQKERHAGGSKWIGTGGTSPFGAYGYNPEGIRIGQDGSRHRRAVKVWDKRQFKNLDDSQELDTRNMKMALRNLRQLTRQGTAEELDLDETIRKTSKNAGLLELEMVPTKKNNVKVLLLLDVGGSMDDDIELCSRLFSAARYEFKHLEYFYFHNCVYDKLWKDNDRRWKDATPTWDVLDTYNQDYKIIFVGDASMSPYEIVMRGGSVEYVNSEAGIEWLDRVKAQFKDMVWLNPVPEENWDYTQSIGMIKEFMNDRMFPLTVAGIGDAVQSLKTKSDM